MPTPKDAPFKVEQRLFRLAARAARKRGPTIFIPPKSHVGRLGFGR